VSDHIPTTAAEMSLSEPLIQGFGTQDDGPNDLHSYLYTGQEVIHPKTVNRPGARHMVVQCTAAQGGAESVRVAAVVSGLPTEIPEWLISGVDKSLL